MYRAYKLQQEYRQYRNHHINNEEYNNYKIKTRGISLARYQMSIANQGYLRENT
jgi:hypothetical protein